MPRGNDRRRSFTAVEMLAVLALLALLAGAAALSLASVRRASDLKSVIERVSAFDALTREQARRQGQPMVLILDTGQSSVSRGLAAASSTGDAPAQTTLYLPEGFSIDRVTTTGRASVAGSVEIPVSASGLSPAYAIQILAGAQRQWIVVSSIGQVQKVDDESTIDQLFDRLAKH